MRNNTSYRVYDSTKLMKHILSARLWWGQEPLSGS